MDNQNQILLKVQNLVLYFPIKRGVFRRTTGYVHAVDNVSFDIHCGETLGLVGESGCGKSTTGRAILHLYRPTAGNIIFDGLNMASLSGGKLRALRKKLQMIFQDPYASLNPRMSVEEIIGEPLQVFGIARGKQRREKVKELLHLVGLNPSYVDRYSHEFSGGQRQRIGIARAISIQPELIVCDEPISALDVSIQAQIVNLMQDLQERFGLTYLFIAHDLSMVRHICSRVAVMYLGKIVEMGERDELYEKPLHPYTKALLSAVPIPDPAFEEQRQRIILSGDVPSPINPPSGCRFRTRCSMAEPFCSEISPEFLEAAHGHYVACHVVNSRR